MGSVGSSAIAHAQLGKAGRSLFDRYDPTEDTKLNDALETINPNYSSSRDYQMNCALCTTAAALALRGYDVEAAPRDTTWRGFNSVFDVDWTNHDNFVAPSTDVNWSGTSWRESQRNPNKFGNRVAGVSKQIEETMQKWGKGSYAAMNVWWKGTSSAHTILVYNDKNNRVSVLDFQTHRAYKGLEGIKSFMSDVRPSKTGLYRLDNAPIRSNIMDLDKIVKRK